MSSRKVFVVVAGLALLLAAGFVWMRASAPAAVAVREEAVAFPERPASGPARAPVLDGGGATAPVEEPMRDADGALRVKTVTASGPFAGAEVTLYLRGPASPGSRLPSWRVAGQGRTDAAGALVLPARPGAYLVTARARGLALGRAEVTRPHGEAVTPVRLLLEPGVSLTGLTVERAGGAPVPMAELTLTPHSGFEDALPLFLQTGASVPDEARHESLSDARGLFGFHGLAPGEYQLEARAPGHAPRRITRVHVPGTDVRVELEGSAFIEGFVTRADGTPAPGARVSAWGADGAVEVEAGDTGSFSLDVPPGSFQVTARLGVETGAAEGPNVVGPGMTVKDVRIRLGGGASLAGVVRRKDSGEAIAGATVGVRVHGDRADLLQARSEADGRFEVGGLAPGAYDVQVRAPGFQPLTRTGLGVLAGQRFELVLEFAAPGRIEGTVVDGSEAPLPGVSVVAQLRWRPLPDALPSVTDAQGRFTLEDVPEGTVYVAARRADSEDEVRQPVRVEAGKTATARLTLVGEGVLEGTVRKEDGARPSGAVTITAHRVGDAASESVDVPAKLDGTWSMRVGAGRYQLSAWLTALRFQNGDQLQVVELEAGGRRHVDLVVGEPRKPLRVTVLEPNGAPSVHATVMATEAGHVDIQAEELTDAAGQAVLALDGLGSDAWRVWSTNGGRQGEAASVSASQKELTLQLKPAARLRGTVRSAGGRDVRGFTLNVTAARGEDDFLSSVERQFSGDAFQVDDVFPTDVTVTATLPDGRAGKVDVTLASGAEAAVEVVVDAGGGISGRLVDARTNEPLAGAYVDADGIASPITGADGRFELKDLAPGAHRLTAWSRGRELVDRRVTLAAGKTQALGDWRLGHPRVEPGRLGLSFGMTGRDVVISAIAAGADVAGLQVGDVVRSIDGAVVLDTGEARRRELGAPGSPAVLALQRGGQALSLTFIRAR
ncbi:MULTISPECIES: carboxypeptidase regulatory-like domain-containing protein [unclassified Corallococcus]|uniref:carboxypeptidase regulatory-like domain-containing protein n=1 Tax=unclassified Corallococcus TaxID=2685029 RepID=UPI001A8D3D8B|nr:MULTISPECIES: carboxypeptidase regulatory-like domain-containing protein [unclassified Corallococcus]MBN9687195.1 carboxypeptidase regulatory-like domain-containing protein [Corallococcus sp. NCSPR001]WAS88978.1 carboxypeptidase regulatory-like domain-containing protein [Corallococcus sp. NCRR]